MSEVKRWKLKGFIPGIEGESKSVFQPTVVLAEDYDAALAREAALREELERFKRLRCSFMKRVLCERDMAEQRLTVAEQLLRECQPALEKAGYSTWQIDEALKPAAEGEGS